MDEIMSFTIKYKSIPQKFIKCISLFTLLIMHYDCFTQDKIIVKTRFIFINKTKIVSTSPDSSFDLLLSLINTNKNRFDIFQQSKGLRHGFYIKKRGARHNIDYYHNDTHNYQSISLKNGMLLDSNYYKNGNLFGFQFHFNKRLLFNYLNLVSNATNVSYYIDGVLVGYSYNISRNTIVRDYPRDSALQEVSLKWPSEEKNIHFTTYIQDGKRIYFDYFNSSCGGDTCESFKFMSNWLFRLDYYSAVSTSDKTIQTMKLKKLNPQFSPERYDRILFLLRKP